MFPIPKVNIYFSIPKKFIYLQLFFHYTGPGLDFPDKNT